MGYAVSYIAGLFDGEGCISSSCQWIKGKYEKYPRISIQITITNQDRGCLDFVCEEFGGVVRLKEKKLNNCFAWVLIGKRPMQAFLRAVSPYLIVKLEQAKLALEFIGTLRGDNLGCVPLSKKVHDKRLAIHRELKRLKRIYSKELS